VSYLSLSWQQIGATPLGFPQPFLSQLLGMIQPKFVITVHCNIKYVLYNFRLTDNAGIDTTDCMCVYPGA